LSILRLTVLYALERSIWHIQTNLVEVLALTRVLNTKCLAVSGPTLRLNPNWDDKLRFAHSDSGPNRSLYSSLTMFEQIRIGRNLPSVGISGWSLFSNTSRPTKHLRASGSAQNSLRKTVASNIRHCCAFCFSSLDLLPFSIANIV
jgi:hypothetical protein